MQLLIFLIQKTGNGTLYRLVTFQTACKEIQRQLFHSLYCIAQLPRDSTSIDLQEVPVCSRTCSTSLHGNWKVKLVNSFPIARETFNQQNILQPPSAHQQIYRNCVPKRFSKGAIKISRYIITSDTHTFAIIQNPITCTLPEKLQHSRQGISTSISLHTYIKLCVYI